MTTAPLTILILGGLSGDYTRPLLTYLLSGASPTQTTAGVPAPPSIALLRIVDRYLILPKEEAYTCYVDEESRKALKSDKVEYRQGNLLNAETRISAFTLPESLLSDGTGRKGFDYVFDFTEETSYEIDASVQIERTLKLALLLGQTAAQSNVGIYIRTLSSFYKVVKGSKKDQVKEGEEEKVECWGGNAAWRHEAARGLAKMEGLNFVAVRPGLLYGDWTLSGLTPRILIGEVYKFQSSKLEFLWSDALPQNTIHSLDLSLAFLSIASWALTASPSTLTSASSLFPSTLTSNDLIKDIPNSARKEDEVRCVVFNVVDEGGTNQADIARITGEVVGIQVGFHGKLISSFAKLNLSDVVEDVNEKHLAGWAELIKSDPNLSATIPISPYVPTDLLQPYAINLNGDKIKELIAWKPLFKLTKEAVGATVEGFKREGNWPMVKPGAKKSKFFG